MDEVGRGALFGPVVAAAVLVTPAQVAQLEALGVRDSKRLSAKRRQALARQIPEIVTDSQIALATAAEIDRLNVLNATLLAMKRAIDALTPAPSRCLIDGNRPVPDLDLPQQTIVGGDDLDFAIAAASILAKVWRDAEIVRLAERYPQYDLARNKGYGTAAHRQALQQFGPCDRHRLSFAPCQLRTLPQFPLETL